jgi:glucose-fructose oxidoreductase
VFGCDSTSEDDQRFDEVPEMTSATLRFPDERLATFTCSFGSADVAWYQITGTKGTLRLEHAFEYSEPMQLAVTAGSRTQRREFPLRDQFAPELLYFSDCILNNRTPEPSGLEGLADVRIIDTLRKSAARRSWMRLGDFPDKRRRPTLEQEIHRPPVRKPELVHTKPPHLDN